VVKVESNMLVLDATFSKQDAEAINYFVEIARIAERERIINLLKDNLEDIPHEGLSFKGEFKTGYIAKVSSLIKLIEEESK
jgi:hypothetical protein